MSVKEKVIGGHLADHVGITNYQRIQIDVKKTLQDNSKLEKKEKQKKNDAGNDKHACQHQKITLILFRFRICHIDFS